MLSPMENIPTKPPNVALRRSQACPGHSGTIDETCRANHGRSYLAKNCDRHPGAIVSGLAGTAYRSREGRVPPCRGNTLRTRARGSSLFSCHGNAVCGGRDMHREVQAGKALEIEGDRAEELERELDGWRDF